MNAKAAIWILSLAAATAVGAYVAMEYVARDVGTGVAQMVHDLFGPSGAVTIDTLRLTDDVPILLHGRQVAAVDRIVTVRIRGDDRASLAVYYARSIDSAPRTEGLTRSLVAFENRAVRGGRRSLDLRTADYPGESGRTAWLLFANARVIPVVREHASP